MGNGPEAGGAGKAGGTGAKAAGPEVVVYSAPACPYCAMAKDYLQNRAIGFTEYDVSRDKAKADEMIAKSGQTGVPVLQINGRIVVGFDRQLIDDALTRQKPPARDVFMGNLFFDPFSK